MNRETLRIHDDENNVMVIELEKKLLRSEREALRRKRITTSVVAFFIFISFSFGFLLGKAFPSQTVIHKNSNSSVDEVADIMQRFWLYGPDFDNLPEEMRIKALKGATSFSFDPYTEFLSKEEVAEFTNHVNMNYTGVGIQMEEMENHDVYVDDVFAGAPADLAGIQVGDLIYEVDGQNVEGKGVQAIRELALGPEGTEVVIKVKRLGEIISFNIIRAAVDISVSGRNEGTYYYLKVATFGENTVEQVKEELEKMQSIGINKLVIDLRDNGGGYLTTVQGMLGLFLKQGSIALIEEYSDGKQNTIYVSENQYDFIDEIVLLQNENSASSSEVFIIGMKEQFPNVTTVGTTTFGKGVIQGQFPLRDGSTLKLTTSKWLSSQGVWVEKKGIAADVEVVANPFFSKRYPALEEGETVQLGQQHEVIELTREALNLLSYQSDAAGSYFDESFKQALNQFQQDYQLEVKDEIDLNFQQRLVSIVRKKVKENPLAYDKQLQEAIHLINE